MLLYNAAVIEVAVYWS